VSCQRCGSEKSYQFEAAAAARARPAPAELPLVCRDCGQITIGGLPVDLPAKLEAAARDLATGMWEAGRDARTKLEGEPGQRIEAYMAEFYKAAYLDGFFRALAFFQHNAKEGRVVRLRNLWKGARVEIPRGSSDVVVRIDGDLYTEFDQLLHLNAVPEISDATRPANKEETLHPSETPLPG
jgi:hypothetical protein